MRAIFYRISIIAIAMYGTASVANAQFDAVSISGSDLKLGMSQTEVLAKIKGSPRLTESPSTPGLWFLGDEKDPDLTHYVMFHSGKLVSVSRSLEQTSDEAAASIGSILYRVLEMAAKAKYPVTITAGDESEVNGQRYRAIKIHIGKNADFILAIGQTIGAKEGHSQLTLTQSLCDGCER